MASCWLLGATPATGYVEFVQNNDMMYFAGVEIPDAALIIDGRSKASTLFFTITDAARPQRGDQPGPRPQRRRPSPASSASLPSTSSRRPSSRLAGSGAVLYTSFKPEELARENSAEKFGIAAERHDPEPLGRPADARTAVRQEPPRALPSGRGQGCRALHLGAALHQVAGRDRPPAQGRPPRRRGPPGDDASHPGRRAGVRDVGRLRVRRRRRPARATSPTTSSSARPRTTPTFTTTGTTAC